ncbi:MAG: patatin-like phospholipase family protein, partial [Methylococcaceae bacterium]
MTTQQSGITFKTVFEKEREVIKQQRENRKDTNLDEKAPDTLIGLAISGGGIRSASFALGVLQSLDKNNKLRSVDYLSTVSGGGYIGASLTWFNYLYKKKYSNWKFPFALGPGTRNSTGVSEEIPLDFLRQHGNYLLPNGITSLALLSVALRNMLLSISVYLAAIVSIIFLTFNLFKPVKWVWPFSELWPDSSASAFVQGMLIVIILFGFTTFLYAWMTSLSRLTLQTEKISYQGRVWFQKHQGLLIALTIASGLLALLPLINTYLLEKLHDVSYMASSLPTIMGIAGAIFGFMQRRHGKRVSSDSLALATSSLLIFGILIIGYKIAYDWNNSSDPFLFGTIIFVILLAGWFVNLNLFGIGRMDRDRLMEAFLPNQDAVNVNKWELATEADVTYFTSVS